MDDKEAKIFNLILKILSLFEVNKSEWLKIKRFIELRYEVESDNCTIKEEL